jgi:hypothetical protein
MVGIRGTFLGQKEFIFRELFRERNSKNLEKEKGVQGQGILRGFAVQIFFICQFKRILSF